MSRRRSIIAFDETVFTRETTIWHPLAWLRRLPVQRLLCPASAPTALATRQDTIDYQIPLVEDMIINEMALEGSFEGYRFYDLMRVALRRGDPAYLAEPVSRRNGEVNDAMRTLLLDTKNWYLPLP